jgi:hypothetical protein
VVQAAAAAAGRFTWLHLTCSKEYKHKQLPCCLLQTYGEPAVTIKPGARLNLVLGPNGAPVPLWQQHDSSSIQTR